MRSRRCGTLASVPHKSHIDALLGACWQWDDDDDDAPALATLRSDLESLLDELVHEIEA